MDRALVEAGRKLEGVVSVIERADLALSTKTKYLATLGRYLDGGNDPYDAEALTRYAEGISRTERAMLSAAVKRYSQALKDHAKATAHPDHVGETQATIWRAEALQDAVKVEASKGTKTHQWLSQAQVKGLLDTCDGSLRGRRDRLALGLLVAAGLRRAEAVALTFDDVLFQPVAGKMRCVLAIEGKGKRKRTVPVSDALAAAIDDWSITAGGGDRVLRSIDQRGRLGESLSGVGVFHIVQAHGVGIGKPGLAPHDLRRTYAQLGYDAGVGIAQISVLLGHASIATTQRYLNLELDLATTVSDFIPF